MIIVLLFCFIDQQGLIFPTLSNLLVFVYHIVQDFKLDHMC